MKKSKRVLAIIVCCILVIASCSVVYAGGIRLNKSKVQLYAGGKTTITAVGGNSNMSTRIGTWELDGPRTVKGYNTSIRWMVGSAFYYGNAMKFANNGSFLYYVGAGNGGKGSYKIGSNSITYSVRTYEEGSLEKGTIKVIKGKNIRLMTRYDIYKIYWKKK